MDNVYYVYDAENSKLIIVRLPSAQNVEEALQIRAEEQGMHFWDWGGVRHIEVRI